MSKWSLALPCLIAFSAHADAPKKTQPTAPAGGGYTGLGADSVPASEIAKFAAPPLDEHVSRKIQAMLDVRGPGNGVITSKGDRMVFGSRVTGTAQVWRQDGAMKFPVQLTAGEDRTSVVGITPDDKWLVLSRDVGGQENPGLYLMSIEGGPLKQVQHLPKVQTALEYVSDDGKALYLRSNDVDAASYAIYRYDLASGKRELVFGEKGLWSIADHVGDTKWLLAKAIGSMQVEIYEYDLAAKKLTPILGQGEKESYDVAYGAKPGQILVLTNKPSDFFRLYALEGGKLSPITPEMKFDIDSFAIDDPRGRIYYRINEHGYAKTKVLDAKTLKELPLPTLPAAENTVLVGVSHNGRFIQLATDGSTLAPQSVVYDWQTNKPTTWRVPMTPEVDVSTFAKASLEYYPARDGTKIPMFVRRPKACNGPCPVVVEFHGGPEGQSQAGFSAGAQLYVDAGFTFVQPNVRGSTGYGKAWLHADDGPKRLDVVSDIEDCAKFIRANWGKDGKAPKIGVSGGSYGGYASLMGMTYFAGAYDAGVENVGISNLITFLQNTAPYRRILRISEYGDPEKDREALIKLSPITHISKIKAPLLVIQGVNDPRVPVGEAMQIYKELERRKIPGGMILFPDEGHGASKRGNIVATIGHSIAFFQKHLMAK
ncbi:MAG: S9 family peptidase [Deltaproteobacteria bacterium]|nr:S9 family peptidase [Deltaproteobacteria bacterium]MCW5807601.1 S9 family peptidase [Deltaproteobacteria bacterium]